MSVDDRFEELLADLAGFYRSWLIYLGLELELFRGLAEAGAPTTASALATATGCDPGAVDRWCRAAYAYRLLELHGGTATEAATDARFRLDEDLATVLLDESVPGYLGGQFGFSVGASLDYAGMAEVFRTGRTARTRPLRYHAAVERLNAQDIALFFEQGLPRLPEVVDALARGAIEALDVACGGGRWLEAMARAYPEARFTGVEFEPALLDRARERIAGSGLADRVELVEAMPERLPWRGRFGLVYVQDALHELPDPEGAVRAGHDALAPGGTLAVLDWCVPSVWDDYRTPLGELIWGYQLDELYQGTRLLTRGEFVTLFERAGLGTPRLLELEAGATVFVATRAAPTGG